MVGGIKTPSVEVSLPSNSQWVRRSGVFGTGLNEGIADAIGLPVDLMTAGLNAGARGTGDLLHALGLVTPAYRMPQIQNPAGGSESVNNVLRLMGLESFTPQDSLDRYINAGGQLLGGTVAGMGAGTTVTEAGPRLMRGLVDSVEDATDFMVSRSARMYDPPAKSSRPFEADYPGGAPADVSGRLTADIEGRPLVATHIVGRQMVGGADVALSPAQYDAVTEAAIGSVPQGYPAGALPRGAVGAYRRTAGPDLPRRNILFRRDLAPTAAVKVTAHEMGHMVDDLAGTIPTDGLARELRFVYNDINNPNLAAARARNPGIDPASRAPLRNYGPEAQGYSRDASPRELIAEAIRAYMADPNYLKTVAPKVAAAIRAAVNGDPVLSKIIQFNGIAPLGAGLLPALRAPGEPKPTSTNFGSTAMHPSVALMLRNPRQRQAIERALASRGRGGDTMIAHINPVEAMMLRRLGGSGTINPRTGLREFTADPRGDIGGGNNHDNQPGNDAGMGGDVGNGGRGGGGYGNASDGHSGIGSGAGAGGGHAGEGGGVNNPRPQPDFPQQPQPGLPQPVTQPPAPVPVATAPMMSTTATTDLTGGRFGRLPGWDLKPYQIGMAPTAYPTPGLTTPGSVTQPGGGGTGGGVVTNPGSAGGGGGGIHTGGGGNGGLGGLGGDPGRPFGGKGDGSRNSWNQGGQGGGNPTSGGGNPTAGGGGIFGGTGDGHLNAWNQPGGTNGGGVQQPTSVTNPGMPPGVASFVDVLHANGIHPPGGGNYDVTGHQPSSVPLLNPQQLLLRAANNGNGGGTLRQPAALAPTVPSQPMLTPQQQLLRAAGNGGLGGLGGLQGGGSAPTTTGATGGAGTHMATGAAGATGARGNTGAQAGTTGGTGARGNGGAGNRTTLGGGGRNTRTNTSTGGSPRNR